MKRLAAVLLLGLAGCGSCGEPVTTTRRGGAPIELQEVAAQPDAPRPGTIYRDAFEAARKEINDDNAEDRLSEIERAIEEK